VLALHLSIVADQDEMKLVKIRLQALLEGRLRVFKHGVIAGLLRVDDMQVKAGSGWCGSGLCVDRSTRQHHAKPMPLPASPLRLHYGTGHILAGGTLWSSSLAPAATVVP
jgi:hypothetical protein